MNVGWDPLKGIVCILNFTKSFVALPVIEVPEYKSRAVILSTASEK